MSEPKLISPLLDNFVMGEPMSSHHGVRCCPAMPKDSNDRYIVKIISVPASQVQLDALLLTGAYPNEQAALEYFQTLAQGILDEAKLMQRLGKLEGFLPFEDFQIEKMDKGTGFDIYLLSPYKRSLERYCRRNSITQLNAVNLGLDLCAAMAVCRKLGYLYVDLKPSNIFISPEQEFRVGDLGFVPLDGLKYASLPDKYRSEYTAPEVSDAFSTLNPTLDVYAIGMILYQIYNDGILPQKPDGEEGLPAPSYADYEMAEIILKACAPDPGDRWQDPLEMGEAIVSYMQRNGANDVPIVPLPVASPIPADTEDEPSAPEEEVEVTETSDEYEQIMLDALNFSADDSEPPAEALHDGIPEELNADDPGNLAFMKDLVNDETAPSEQLAIDIAYYELTQDTSDILAQADELLAHETPEGVVQPEAIDVPIPPPIIPEPEPPLPDLSEEDEPTVEETIAAVFEAEDELSEVVEVEEESIPEEPKKKKSVKKIVAISLVLLLLAGLAFGAYYYYNNYYIQTIDNITLIGSEDHLTVSIASDIDDQLLQVICTDTYGQKQVQDVVDGIVKFDNLNPNTLYTIKVEIEGFHQLNGRITATYTTPGKSNILDFSAITGSEAGSVILRFSVEGADTDVWTVEYTAEGEESKSVSFSDHMVTITGLTVGKEYTFQLVDDGRLYIVGQHTIAHTASDLISAQDLTITSCSSNCLTASWTAPEGQAVSSWTVRCYNDAGYDETITVTECAAVFTDLDCSKGYTVEVTAEGMTTCSRAYVSENSLTIFNPTVKATTTSMEVEWDFSGNPPTGGWLLLYTIDGSSQMEVTRTDESLTVITPVAPGAEYHFTVQTESGVTLFENTFSTTVPEAASFSGYTVNANNIRMAMCLTEDIENFKLKDWRDLKGSKYTTTTFAAGSKVAIPLRLTKTYDTSRDLITTTFVIRDEAGAVFSTSTSTRTWTNMWFENNCTLEIPAIPDIPGNYTVEVYFNGAYVGTLDFTVTAAT